MIDTDRYGWKFERQYRKPKPRFIAARGWFYIALIASAMMLGALAVGAFPMQAFAIYTAARGGM